jgi:hypothetical protein
MHIFERPAFCGAFFLHPESAEAINSSMAAPAQMLNVGDKR